jgi:outer membrane cobalamin receptor
VADALRGIPGGEVSLSRGGLAGNGKQESLIRLRGFETTDVMIMIDGMPLTEPYMKRVDLNQLLLDNVAKIKVIKGPSSVLYGPNTAGGVVNIVTQEGGAFRTRLQQQFADFKSFRTIGNTRGMVGPVRYVLGGSYDISDGFPISRDFAGTPNQPGTKRENSDYERYNLTGRLSMDLGSRGSLAVAGGYYDFEGGVPYDMYPDPNVLLWRKDWNRWYVNGAGDYAFTDNLGLKAQLFYDDYDNKIKTYTDTTFEEIVSNGNGISTHDNSLFGYFVNPYWDLGKWSYLNAGIRYQKDDVSIQSSIGDPWRDYASETFSFSLEDEIRPHEKVSLVAGVAYNLYRKLKAYQMSPGDDIDSVDFQAGVLYTPWQFLKTHASIAKKTTFPTMRQLYAGEIARPNPDLTEQTALVYEIAVEANYKNPYPYGSFTLFRSDVDDMIGRKELGNVFMYENIDEAVLQGLELALSWVPIDPLLLRCAYTYLDTEDKRSDRLLKELDFRPNHLFAIQARYQSSFGLSVNTRYIYTSSQEYEQKGAVPPLVMVLPARGVWDIHVGQKFPFRRYPDWFVELFLDVNNVLDEYYEMDPGKAAPGRVVWGGIRAEF